MKKFLEWFIYFAFAAVFIFGVTSKARAGEVTLPFANGAIGGEYQTDLHIANPSDQVATIHPSRFGADARQVAPRSSIVLERWPQEGLGFARFNVPDGLSAYVRVTIDDSHMVQIEPLQPISADRPALFLDMPKSARYRSFLMFGTIDGSTATLTYFGSDFAVVHDLGFLAPGETRVVEVSAQDDNAIGLSASSRFALPGWTSGVLYAFGMIAKQPSGEILDVYPFFNQ